VSNFLPVAKRAAILDMHAGGAGVREIARATDVHRSTVRTCIDRIDNDRHELIVMHQKLETALVGRFGDEALLDELMAIGGALRWSCPIHPEASMEDDFGEDGEGCLLCAKGQKARAREGLIRHHARHKAAGTPIVPPWRRQSVQDAEQAPAQDPIGNAVAVEAPAPIIVPTAQPATLGSVVAGPPPKGRKHTPTRLEVQGHQANKENRQRVCVACITPADIDLGSFRRLASDPCARCGSPTSDGRIVRQAKPIQPDRVFPKIDVTPYVLSTK
jgi:hypothetical protein